MSTLNPIKLFLTDETGAELAEYAIGVTLLVAIGVVVYKAFGVAVGTAFNTVGNSIKGANPTL